eukprot:g1209.t1
MEAEVVAKSQVVEAIDRAGEEKEREDPEEEEDFYLQAVALVVDDKKKGTKMPFFYSNAESDTDRTLEASTSLFSTFKIDILDRIFKFEVDDNYFVTFPVRGRRSVKDAKVECDDDRLNGSVDVLSKSKQTSNDGSKSNDSTPAHLTLAETSGKQRAAETYHTKSSVSKSSPVAMFNIVFALKRARDPIFFKNHASVTTLKDTEYVVSVQQQQPRRVRLSEICRVLRSLVRTLCGEELRCQYVSNQSAQLLNLRDAFDTAIKRREASNSANRIPPESVRRRWDALAVRSVSLAKELKLVYEQVRFERQVDVLLNRWLHLSVSFERPTVRRGVNLHPYHTLVLLQDKSKILLSMPPNSSMKLRRLIESCSSFKCLEDLQVVNELSTEQMHHICDHMIYWKKARLGVVINAQTKFTIMPNVDLSEDGRLCRCFCFRFRRVSATSFFRLMSKIAEGTRVGELATGEWRNERTKNFVRSEDGDEVTRKESGGTGTNVRLDEILEWLLRVRAIVELHEYICRTANPPVGGDRTTLLERILPFCDGKHPLEEIMYFTGLTRAAIRSTVTANKKCLCIFTRPRTCMLSC